MIFKRLIAGATLMGALGSFQSGAIFDYIVAAKTLMNPESCADPNDVAKPLRGLNRIYKDYGGESKLSAGCMNAFRRALEDKDSDFSRNFEGLAKTISPNFRPIIEGLLLRSLSLSTKLDKKKGLKSGKDDLELVLTLSKQDQGKYTGVTLVEGPLKGQVVTLKMAQTLLSNLITRQRGTLTLTTFIPEAKRKAVYSAWEKEVLKQKAHRPAFKFYGGRVGSKDDMHLMKKGKKAGLRRTKSMSSLNLHYTPLGQAEKDYVDQNQERILTLSLEEAKEHLRSLKTEKVKAKKGDVAEKERIKALERDLKDAQRALEQERARAQAQQASAPVVTTPPQGFAPPPPPPPLPPMGQSGIAPPPPPPPMPTGTQSPRTGLSGGLLSQIQGGTQLKKTGGPQKSQAVDSNAAHLAAIRGGVKLKKVDRSKKNEKPKAAVSPQDALQNQLSKALAQRRQAVRPPSRSNSALDFKQDFGDDE